MWEDLGKAHGIEKAVAQFEKENNCKVILKDSDYVGHLTAYEKAVKDGSQIPDVVMLPADRVGSAAKDGLIAPLAFMKMKSKNICNHLSLLLPIKEIFTQFHAQWKLWLFITIRIL